MTFEAVWHILISEFVNWLTTADRDISEDFLHHVVSGVINAFETDNNPDCKREFEAMSVHLPMLVSCLQDFIVEHSNECTFQYWISYLKMINTLLRFVKAERLGMWHEHLSAYEDMLALLAAHDHTNYMR